MTVPPSSIRTEVNYFLTMESDFRGVSSDSFTAIELQTIAYAIRLSADLLEDGERRQQFFQISDALDGLAELGEKELAYLEKLPH